MPTIVPQLWGRYVGRSMQRYKKVSMHTIVPQLWGRYVGRTNHQYKNINTNLPQLWGGRSIIRNIKRNNCNAQVPNSGVSMLVDPLNDIKNINAHNSSPTLG